MSEDVPPDNDDIDYAVAIPTLPYTIQEDTVAATEDDSDPWHTCTGDWDLRTVWFYYTATFNGTVRINTFGSDYDTVLSVYDGDTGDEIECNDDASDDTYQSAVDLPVTAGKSYWIEVSEYDDEYATGGTLFLNLVGAGSGGAASANGPEVIAAVDEAKMSRVGTSRPARRCCKAGGSKSPGIDVRMLHRRRTPPDPFAGPRLQP
jgi:hypothetical protein